MSTTEYPHIALNAEGVPMLAGTQTKVVEVALDHVAQGWDAEEIHRQYPELTFGQIYSALAYYYDHQADIDQDIERRLKKVDDIAARLGPGPLILKLRALGRLPP
jgi:uncharacterized protein (DUF433 family)